MVLPVLFCRFSLLVVMFFRQIVSSKGVLVMDSSDTDMPMVLNFQFVRVFVVEFHKTSPQLLRDEIGEKVFEGAVVSTDTKLDFFRKPDGKGSRRKPRASPPDWLLRRYPWYARANNYFVAEDMDNNRKIQMSQMQLKEPEIPSRPRYSAIIEENSSEQRRKPKLYQKTHKLNMKKISTAAGAQETYERRPLKNCWIMPPYCRVFMRG